MLVRQEEFLWAEQEAAAVAALAEDTPEAGAPVVVFQAADAPVAGIAAPVSEEQAAPPDGRAPAVIWEVPLRGAAPAEWAIPAAAWEAAAFEMFPRRAVRGVVSGGGSAPSGAAADITAAADAADA
ncbi:MAG: hypothetical protein LUH20_11570 [Lachnospiraceae bacterium]|nr:hypothetical protein [Lachnospiraceae bacterium]